MDYVAEYKVTHFIPKSGLDGMMPGFKEGLEARMAKNLPNKAVQTLSLNVFGKLLEEGKHVLYTAAYFYRFLPDIFKTQYAFSQQAFSKDRYFFQKVPVHSFPPFKTGENPAIIRDEKFSLACADLYDQSRGWYMPDIMTNGYLSWLNSSAGDKFSREISWLQTRAGEVRQKMLETSKQDVTSIMAIRGNANQNK